MNMQIDEGSVGENSIGEEEDDEYACCSRTNSSTHSSSCSSTSSGTTDASEGKHDGSDQETHSSENEDDDRLKHQINNKRVDNVKWEICIASGSKVELPQDLCEHELFFRQLLDYPKIWKECLTDEQRKSLSQYLPKLPKYYDSITEHEKTLEMLFLRENRRFGVAALDTFKNHLLAGHFRPDIRKIRRLVLKAQQRRLVLEDRKRIYYLADQLFESRKSLLMDAYNRSYGQPFSSRAMSKLQLRKLRPAEVEEKTQIRYMEELEVLRSELGMPHVLDMTSENGEDYYQYQISNLNRKKKRRVQMNFSPSQLQPHEFLYGDEDIRPVFSTLQRSEYRTNSHFIIHEMTEDSYIPMLVSHKKRRFLQDVHPELNTQGIALSDLSRRAQIGRKYKFVGNSLRVSSSKKKMKIQPNVNILSVPKLVTSPTSLEMKDDCPLFLGAAKTVPLYQESEVSSPNSIPVKLEALGNLEYPQISKKKFHQITKKTPRLSETEEGTREYMEIDENLRAVEYRFENEGDDDDSVNEEYLDENDAMHIPHLHDHRSDVSEKGKCRHIRVPTIPNRKSVSNGALENIILNENGDLMQETHACFFSLLRDAFTSRSEYRMSENDVKDAITLWQVNPISPLNDWYALSTSWTNLVPSALGFLAGDLTYAQDLELQGDRNKDFVPYLENKGKVYAWIGAGRDSDSHLVTLCSCFLIHRETLKPRVIDQNVLTIPVTLENIQIRQIMTKNAKETVMKSVKSASPAVESIATDYGSVAALMECEPPQAQWPTEWKVRLSSLEEKEEFQRQERLRYAAPHKAFTYKMHGYASVVGPVKGIYQQNVGAGLTKPRGHSLLVPDRPNFVTILALVRDATARLPNGEGTRADICMLLKDSQYIKDQSDQIGNDKDNYLNSVVSGALDRLHYEADPCVRYYPRRKEWLYLHRARSESEFEMYHQQLQGVAKNKKHPGGGSKNKSIQLNPKLLNGRELSPSGVSKEIMLKKELKFGSFQTEPITKKEIQTHKVIEKKIPMDQMIPTVTEQSLPITSVSNVSIPTSSSIATVSQTVLTNSVPIRREPVIPFEIKTQPVTSVKNIASNVTGKSVTLTKTNSAQSLLQSNQHYPHHQIQVSTSAGLQTIRLSGHSILQSAQPVPTPTGSVNSQTGAATIFQNAKIQSHTQGALLANHTGKSILQTPNLKQQTQQQAQHHVIPGKTLLASQIKLVSPGQIKSLLGHGLQGQTIFIKQSSTFTCSGQQLKQQLPQSYQTQSQTVQSQGMQRIIAQIGGKPIAVQIQHTPQQQQQQQQKILAKVLTTAGGGQIISVENLLAHKGLKLASTTSPVSQVNRQSKQVIPTQYQVIPQVQTSPGQALSISNSQQQVNPSGQTVRMMTAQLAGKPIVLTSGNKNVGVGITQSGGMVLGKQSGQKAQGQQPLILPSQLLNIKTLHSLKVIPTPTGLKSGAAVYTRVMAPTTTPVTQTTITQQKNLHTQSPRSSSFGPS